jgi:hypothetical protein
LKGILSLMALFTSHRVAGLAYHGSSKTTQSCVKAIARLIQAGEWITQAFLLTADDRHCFVLEVAECELVVVKAGFASGYSGEGPRGLAFALCLLRRHGVDVEELVVSPDVLRRVDESRLTESDLKLIDISRAVRPVRLEQYTYGVFGSEPCAPKMRTMFPLVVPFGLVDERIIDLAVKLAERGDSAITDAFKRLESIFVVRCGISDGYGVGLFQKALKGPNSLLTWEGIGKQESEGRAELFIAVYRGFRNRRAHKELDSKPAEALREFLLVNELFLLEAEAVERTGKN